MTRGAALLATALLAAALAGCAPTVLAVPNATLAPIRLAPCPARVPATARAVACPTPAE